MAKSPRQPMSIKTAVYACLLGGIVALSAATAYFAPGYLRNIYLQNAEDEVRLRSKTVAIDLARVIHTDWVELGYLAKELQNLDPDTARQQLNGVVNNGRRISWAGLAGTDGKVKVASGGLLEDVDVSGRPWFQAGLRGGFSGDVHEAVLLQRLLGGQNREPIRFIDLALPVKDSGGETTGVIAYHLNFDWTRNYLIESAKIRNMDFLLISSAGDVIASSIHPLGNLSSLGSVRAATAGISTAILETWPDGKEYFSAVVPEVTFADLPSYGWRLVGRVPTGVDNASTDELLRNVFLFALAACLIFTVAATVFVAVYIRPLDVLSDTAERIARGEDVYPSETRSSREAARLSAALARIQSRLSRLTQSS